MTVKIISKSVKICSLIVFTKCLKANIALIFVKIFSEQFFLSLIILKSSRKAALTIANAPSTLCAGKKAALTSFVFLFTIQTALTAGKNPREPIQRTSFTKRTEGFNHKGMDIKEQLTIYSKTCLR
ncbi:MAG: hypothetical protein ACI3X6_08995 [Alloprevotella sp.]